MVKQMVLNNEEEPDALVKFYIANLYMTMLTYFAPSSSTNTTTGPFSEQTSWIWAL